MQDAVENVLNALQKFSMLGIGGEWNLVGPEVQDPTPFVDMLITMKSVFK